MSFEKLNSPKATKAPLSSAASPEDISRIPDENSAAEQKENDSAGYEANKETVRAIIQLIETEKAKGSAINRLNIDLIKAGVIGGSEVTLKWPDARKGKHAEVVLASIHNKQATFDCVLRDSVRDAEEYRENLEKNPAVAKFVPKLYDVVGKWAVLEKIAGLELRGITERLDTDPDFTEKYAAEAFSLIQKTAQEHLRLDDVKFADGHNCMADPETGAVQLIEQKAVYPTSIPSEELMATQLLKESTRARSTYAFKLLRDAFSQVPPESLRVRPVAVRPTHPAYRDWYALQEFNVLSKEEHQRILDNPDLRENLLVYGGDGNVMRTFAPECIRAVQENKYQDFVSLLEAGKVESKVMMSDPSYERVVLPDESHPSF